MTDIALTQPWEWEYNGDTWGFDPRVEQQHELEQFDIPSAERNAIVQAHYWKCVRAIRDEKLADTDWVVARATELGEAVPSDYATYRQALRDITQQADPRQIEWPLLNGQPAWPSEPVQTGGAQSPQFTGGEVVEEDNPLFTPGT